MKKVSPWIPDVAEQNAFGVRASHASEGREQVRPYPVPARAQQLVLDEARATPFEERAQGRSGGAEEDGVRGALGNVEEELSNLRRID